MIYQNEYNQLIEICRQITRHRQMLAKPRLEQLILETVDETVPNPKLLSHFIAEALMRRLDRQLVESKNIYVQEFDIPQIDLFYSMAEAVPFVYTGHLLANSYMARAVEGLTSFTVLDVGIGNGGQVTKLLDSLAADPGGLESVRVIGLDPFCKNLEDAAGRLEKAKTEYPFAVEFEPWCNLLENLEDSDFEMIREKAEGNLVINMAFAFHHTSHPLNDQQARTNLLKKLAGLQPKVLTLIEPNSNHDTEDLVKRIHHCWEHFGNVFSLVDEAEIDRSHKYLIKGKFFAREIGDIFGVSDHFRSERHELYDSWLLRLFKAGYKPVDLGTPEITLPEHCSYTSSDGLIRMNYNAITIVAVMAFTT